MYYYFIWFN